MHGSDITDPEFDFRPGFDINWLAVGGHFDLLVVLSNSEIKA